MYRDATERITRDQLHGAPKKAKRHGTRSPIKDLLCAQQEVVCAVYPEKGVDVRLHLPIRAVSELNQRESWPAKHKRKKVQQDIVTIAWRGHKVGKYIFDAPYHIRFTRIGSRKLDPDAVAASMKHVQDAVCRELGIDDGRDDLITFEYAQEPLGKREYAVRIEIRGSVKP